MDTPQLQPPTQPPTQPPNRASALKFFPALSPKTANRSASGTVVAGNRPTLDISRCTPALGGASQPTSTKSTASTAPLMPTTPREITRETVSKKIKNELGNLLLEVPDFFKVRSPQGSRDETLHAFYGNKDFIPLGLTEWKKQREKYVDFAKGIENEEYKSYSVINQQRYKAAAHFFYGFHLIYDAFFSVITESATDYGDIAVRSADEKPSTRSISDIRNILENAITHLMQAIIINTAYKYTCGDRPKYEDLEQTILPDLKSLLVTLQCVTFVIQEIDDKLIFNSHLVDFENSIKKIMDRIVMLKKKGYLSDLRTPQYNNHITYLQDKIQKLATATCLFQKVTSIERLNTFINEILENPSESQEHRKIRKQREQRGQTQDHRLRAAERDAVLSPKQFKKQLNDTLAKLDPYTKKKKLEEFFQVFKNVTRQTCGKNSLRELQEMMGDESSNSSASCFDVYSSGDEKKKGSTAEKRVHQGGNSEESDRKREKTDAAALKDSDMQFKEKSSTEGSRFSLPQDCRYDYQPTAGEASDGPKHQEGFSPYTTHERIATRPQEPFGDGAILPAGGGYPHWDRGYQGPWGSEYQAPGPRGGHGYQEYQPWDQGYQGPWGGHGYQEYRPWDRGYQAPWGGHGYQEYRPWDRGYQAPWGGHGYQEYRPWDLPGQTLALRGNALPPTPDQACFPQGPLVVPPSVPPCGRYNPNIFQPNTGDDPSHTSYPQP